MKILFYLFIWMSMYNSIVFNLYIVISEHVIKEKYSDDRNLFVEKEFLIKLF